MTSIEERKLADEEMPLLVQLNWHKDDREGRFLLRRMDEKTYVSIILQPKWPAMYLLCNARH